MIKTLAAACALALTALASTAGATASPGGPGAVYILTNSSAGNAVAIFDRAGDGTLTPAGTVASGGNGSGGGLGNQGAVILSDNERLLFAVNAGSNTVSSFAVEQDGLRLVDTEPSGGSTPISLTHRRGLLYVLNAGTPNSISGLTVGKSGELAPLPGSTRSLSAAQTGPAQIEFSPAGDVLVVTEKATNLIDTYTVGSNGLPTGPASQPSAGATPFGFAFDKRGHLIVSDAFGGAPGASALSSYRLGPGGALGTITPLAPTNQTAACWVVTTKNGRYAYTTNTGSGSISGYSIGHDGSLALLDADGVTGVTGAGPIDMALSESSRFLYTLDSGSHGVSGFRVQADGSLTPISGLAGLPASANGMAAR